MRILLTTALFLVWSAAIAQKVNISQLQRDFIASTILISSTNEKGGMSLATSFLYVLPFKGEKLLTLITNKHVIEGSTDFLISFTEGEKGRPKYGYFASLNLKREHWTLHPTEDLAIAIISRDYFKTGRLLTDVELYFHAIEPPELAVTEDTYSPIEHVYMAGYPDALVDNKNNFPIVRSGCTATPVYVDFKRTPRFLVDIAMFQGSSGSPVVSFKNNRIELLGIASALRLTDEGLPINIAIVVKASSISDFIPILSGPK